MKSTTVILSAIIILTILTIIIAVKLNNNRESQENQEDKTVCKILTSYTDAGMLYAFDNLLRYTDVKSGKSIILCDKPNCRHQYDGKNVLEQSCNAVVQGLVSAIAIYHNQLYYALDDKRVTWLFEASVNGSDRKAVTRLENVQGSPAAVYQDDYLLYSYVNTYDYEAEEIQGVKLDKPIAGMAVIDLKTKKTVYLPEKEAYEASMTKPYEYQDKIYYEYSYRDVKIDYFSFDFTLPENQEYLKEISHTGLYCYDLKTEKETCIYSGKSFRICDYQDNYAYILEDSSRLYELNLSDGKLTLLVEEQSLNTCHADGDRLILTLTTSDKEVYLYKYYDLKSGELISLGQSNALLGIDAVLKDIIYVDFLDKEQICIGYITKQEFYDLSFEHVVPLVYPNSF